MRNGIFKLKTRRIRVCGGQFHHAIVPRGTTAAASEPHWEISSQPLRTLSLRDAGTYVRWTRCFIRRTLHATCHHPAVPI